MDRKELLDACYDENKRILKQYGYYYNAHLKEGKKPEDLEDVDGAEIERIAAFLKNHPMYPQRKRRKHIRYRGDVYYLGDSYGLKHVVERFLTPSYCANGDFIAACMAVGFVVVPQPESPNADIYIPCDRVRSSERYYIAVL